VKHLRLFNLFSVTLISVLFFVMRPVYAGPTSNPVFATVEFVQDLFQQNESDLEFLTERARAQDEKIAVQEARIGELENATPVLPEGKWVHVCFDVATKNLFVMKDGTCFPHVHWKIFVQCYLSPGSPCAPDNPLDTYYVPPQEQ
jgi:hypothetical protein